MKNTTSSCRIITSLLQTAVIVIGLTGAGSCSKKDDATPPVDTSALPVAVVKTNPIKVYMHYMPWFQSKPISGYWGSHWRMNNKNPDVVDANGKRQIASHFYPLIGPYDSKDPDVINYHMLLLKYAGVDGILIDWYGSHPKNDYGTILNNTNAIIGNLDAIGMQFGIVYEEYVAQYTGALVGNSPIKAAQEDIAYMASNYWTKSIHIKVNEVPLLLTFGPRFFLKSTDWDQIFSLSTTKPTFLPLWYHEGYTGSNARGEFTWVDFTAGQSTLPTYYTKPKAPGYELTFGSAFPRYYDFYVEGGEGQSNGYVDFANGETLSNTLNQASVAKLKYIQVVTFNDFGEGTIMEPTQEDQFKCLEILQTYAGVPYGHDELVLVYNYFLKTQQYKNDAAVKAQLKEVFNKLVTLKVSEATTLLAAIP